MQTLVYLVTITVMAFIFTNKVALANTQVSGCEIFPSDNTWNTPIDTLPVDPQSDTYIDTIGRDKNFHPDFGAGLYNGGPIGIPFNIVDALQTSVSVEFTYASESDAGPYPIPENPQIEGGVNSTGDRHILILEKNSCTLYELFNARYDESVWRAGSGAVYNLSSNDLRPSGWTSADAAGLPILPGLIRYSEVEAGEINHAIRFTVPRTRNTFVWPARHHASSLTSSQYPPMGQTFRLKSSFNTNAFSTEIKVILKAMKKYGIILADNGSSWYISGVPDDRWDNDQIRELRQLTGNNFEAVDISSLIVNMNSGQVNSSSPNTPNVPSEIKHIIPTILFSLE